MLTLLVILYSIYLLYTRASFSRLMILSNVLHFFIMIEFSHITYLGVVLSGVSSFGFIKYIKFYKANDNLKELLELYAKCECQRVEILLLRKQLFGTSSCTVNEEAQELLAKIRSLQEGIKNG